MYDDIVARFRAVLPPQSSDGAFVSLRIVDEQTDLLGLRSGVLEPPSSRRDVGAMVTVHRNGGLGYAATSDLRGSGLRQAIEKATDWAEQTSNRALFDTRAIAMPAPTGTYQTPVKRPWSDVPVAERVAWLQHVGQLIGNDPRIVDWESSLFAVLTRSRYVTSHGADIYQELHHLAPDVTIMAAADGVVQKRSTGMRGFSQQGGWEVVARSQIESLVPRFREEAFELLTAPNCPSGTMHLLLDPGQMMLQIHESIGHPLELDRILGDERNYAGRSFVSPEM
ncbi:MAG TPA: peptidase C69, partial [Deltaproteobacteria bacterium]|nr:peptidase C69 [Deltaproteobacteria bacterium]